MTAVDLEHVRAVASAVPDPEMPMLTLADLGVLRGVTVETDAAGTDTVVVTLTPTYSGCPALDEMRADLRRRLRGAGYTTVATRVTLSPPWTTDLISDEGRRRLAAAGVAPPAHVGAERPAGPVALTLDPPPRVVACPHCGAADTEVVSAFGPTACTALRRCRVCAEPFEHLKEIA